MNKLRFNDSEYPLFYPNYNIADNYEKITNGMNKFSLQMTSLIKDFQYEYLALKEALNIIKNKIILSCIDGKIAWSKELKENIKIEYTKNEGVGILNKLYKNDKNFINLIDRLYDYIDTEITLRKDPEIEISSILHILDQFNIKYINIDAKDKFYSFIGSLCFDIQKFIFGKEIFIDNSTLRIHFRIVNITEDEIKYKKLFSLSIIKESDQKN